MQMLVITPYHSVHSLNSLMQYDLKVLQGILNQGVAFLSYFRNMLLLYYYVLNNPVFAK